MERVVLQLEKARRRFATGEEAQTRYRFSVLRRDETPEDEG